MDLSTKTLDDLLNTATVTEDKETLREIAKHLGVSFSGNTGIEKLRENILADIETKMFEPVELDEPEEADPVFEAMKKSVKEAKKAPRASVIPPVSELVHMNPRAPGISEPLKRAIIRAKALRLVRCRIQNLDPSDAALPGMIITCYNKYTGKVSKYVPFGEENDQGWHLPQIIVNELEQRQFPMRKEIKTRGSSFGVAQYKTQMMRKFSVEKLPPLTKQELEALAQDQKARGAIDTSN